MEAQPVMMVRGGSSVEHAFGYRISWILGICLFLHLQELGAPPEMVLWVHVYNLKRAIIVMGALLLIELWGEISLFISKHQNHQRPEPVGALDFSGVSAFSHALSSGAFLSVQFEPADAVVVQTAEVQMIAYRLHRGDHAQVGATGVVQA